MRSGNLNDLAYFVEVARERSFTKAAAKLGVSQSALSQTIRSLEARVGLRLLTRTTRSVAPTAAGERLLQTIAPRFDEIESALSSLNELRDKPAGTIRLTAGEHPALSVLQPALANFFPTIPTSKSKSPSTTDSRTSSLKATTPACDSVSRSQKTWSRFGLVQTFEWRSLAPPLILCGTQFRRHHKT